MFTSTYKTSGWRDVEGWMQSILFPIIAIAEDVHRTKQVAGNICEIGVHHGKFFLALSEVARDDEKLFAIDIFDDQELNIDRSGRGAMDRFLANVDAHGRRDQTVAIQADSLNYNLASFERDVGTDPIRLFSVDGGHTAHHAINDLCLAQDVLPNYGVVFLDDYLNPGWMGVHEGFVRFLDNHNRSLAPFLFAGNKLMLTTISTHEFMYQRFTTGLKEAGISASRLRRSELGGFNVLSIKG